MPDTIEWLTGIVESEGYLGFHPYTNHKTKGKQYHYPTVRLVVKMADRDVVDRVASMFGTRVIAIAPRNSRCLPLWKASVSGKKALAIMLEMFPLFGNRRKKKVNNLLAKWEENCFA